MRFNSFPNSLVILPLILGISASCSYINPSARDVQIFKRSSDGKEVHCLKPPPDVISKRTDANLEVTVDKITSSIKGAAGLRIDPERIRKELPEDVNAFEVIEYRICAQYGNDVLTAEEYKVFTQQYLPLRRNTDRSAVSPDIPSPKPTPADTVGIWVARIRGDTKQFSAQREIIQKLEYARRNSLLSLEKIELRELPYEITTAVLNEQELELKRYGQELNAAMIVWGEIAGFEISEFFPRITLIQPIGRTDTTTYLTPVTQATRWEEQYQVLPPGTARLPPERIREPLSLARYILAFRHFQQKEWGVAAAQFDQIIVDGAARLAKSPDVYFYAGFSHFMGTFGNPQTEDIRKELAYFTEAKIGYEKDNSMSDYAASQNMRGITCLQNVRLGKDVNANLGDAIISLEEAARTWNKIGDKHGYRTARGNLGLAYALRVRAGIDIQNSTLLAATILEESSRESLEASEFGGYASDQVNIGTLFLELARHKYDQEKNLLAAIEHFRNAAKHNKSDDIWGTYNAANGSLGEAHLELVKLNIQSHQNIQDALAAWRENVRIYKANNSQSIPYADIQTHIADAHFLIGQHVKDFAPHFKTCIEVLEDAIAVYINLNQWDKAFGAKFNAGVVHLTLAINRIEVSDHLDAAEKVFLEGKNQSHEKGYVQIEARFTQALNDVKELRRTSNLPS